MKLFLAALVVLTLVALAVFGSPAEEDDVKWEAFKAAHSKSYECPLEDAHRKFLFLQSEAIIEAHNSNEDRSFSMGHNMFSDMTEEERVKFIGRKKNARSAEMIAASDADFPVDSAGERAGVTIDYRNHPCMPPVKSQGDCGSCWAFAATTPLEFHHCVTHGNVPVNLSEQQLIDCDPISDGCDSGITEDAWLYLRKAGGAMLSSDYPYRGGTGKCAFDAKKARVKVAGRKKVPKFNKAAIIEALANKQLVATSIADSDRDFARYSSGVFDGVCRNGADDLSHQVVIVGYDVAQDAWIGRNSWGPKWGRSGYFLIKAGVNKCGIETEVWTVTAAP